MQMNTNEIQIIRPGEYVAMVRRWWWLLLLVPLLTTGSAYLFSSRQPNIYTASTRLFVSQASPQSSDVTAARLLTKSYSELVTSQPILERVVADLQLPISVDELRSKTSSATPIDTQLIDISVRDADSQQAIRIADSLATNFSVWANEQQDKGSERNASALQASIVEVQARLEQLTTELEQLRSRPQSTLSAEDKNRIALLGTLRTQQQANYQNLVDLQQRIEFVPKHEVEIVEPAHLPQTSPRPAWLLDTAIAFILGLALVVVGVVVFERVSNRLYLSSDVSAKTGLPVLETLPALARAQHSVAAQQSPLFSQQIRSLHAQLQLWKGDNDKFALLLTSSEANEGKSLVAANLAASMAQAGQKVVLIDGDLYQPRQHTLFGVSNTGGLAKVLRQATGEVEQSLTPTTIPGLRLLVAGSGSTQSVEVLTPKRLKAIINSLRATTDTVIVDGPPTLVGDALLEAIACDGVLFISQAGKTSLDQLRAAALRLTQGSASVLGVVIYGVTERWFKDHYTPYAEPASRTAPYYNKEPRNIPLQSDQGAE